ncbi:MAG: diacylglycerol kinase family lipid kinase, partial [Brevundimonas sp.]
MAELETDSAVAPSTSDASRSAVLTSEATLKRVVMLINPLSGGVGPRAQGEAEVLLAEYPFEADIVALTPDHIDKQIGEALDAKPDLLIVLAGDGTARAVASRAGPKGPLIAPLPGGTMNMLPKALYGTADWKLALRKALEEGVPQPVSGGEVEGEAFYCAAILGSPALWAPAREAIRKGRLSLAWQYGRRALKRAFSGRLKFRLDGAEQ